MTIVSWQGTYPIHSDEDIQLIADVIRLDRVQEQPAASPWTRNYSQYLNAEDRQFAEDLKEALPKLAQQLEDSLAQMFYGSAVWHT
jgi:hypothetical protein